MRLLIIQIGMFLLSLFLRVFSPPSIVGSLLQSSRL